MAVDIRPDGTVLYDDYEDLRGNRRHKDIEKSHGPHAAITLASGETWLVWMCPICKCNKSFDASIPNKVSGKCDGDCPCHDGLPDEQRYAR